MPETITTERLVLRPYEDDDREAFIALNGDREVRRYMDGPLSADAAGRLFERLLSSEFRELSWAWAVVDAERELNIGHAFVSRSSSTENPQLGFLFLREHWGLGYGTEVARATARFIAESTDIDCLTATVDLDHHASIRVLEKAGFVDHAREHDADGPFLVFRLDLASLRDG